MTSRTLVLERGLLLESGVRLAPVEIAYRTWGRLDSAGSNAVLVCHALTGTADVDFWWPGLIGKGIVGEAAPLDLRHDFVIASNVLGGCAGTTGPTSLAPDGRRWGSRFPRLTIRDQVRCQRELLRFLGVQRLRGVIGGSLGGHQALEWLLLYPGLVDSAILLSSSGRHSSWCIAASEAQRQAIFTDPRWRDGDYPADDPPVAGLAAARQMAMWTYRSAPGFAGRFGRQSQPEGGFRVERYLREQGEKLVRRFDAASYVALTRTMDTHDIARGRGDYADVLSTVRAPVLVVGCVSDVLYPLDEQRELSQLIPGARLQVLDSPHGHDAFLIETESVFRAVTEFHRSTSRRAVPAETASSLLEVAS